MVHELKACDIRWLGARATAFVTGLRRLLSSSLLTELGGNGRIVQRSKVGEKRNGGEIGLDGYCTRKPAISVVEVRRRTKSAAQK
jgi:hypothetical protein